MNTSREQGPDTGSFIVDRNGTILGFDEGMERMTHYTAFEVVGRRKDFGLQPIPGEGPAHRAARLPLYAGQIDRPHDPAAARLTLNSSDGSILEVEANIAGLDGPGDRTLVSVLRVISRSTPMNQVGEVHPDLDLLTGTCNLSAFETRLDHEIETATLDARPLSLVLVDVDGLRRWNNEMGRRSGDHILQQLAGILRNAVTKEPNVFRLGEDDFAILLPNGGRGEARQAAARVRSLVEKHRFLASNLGSNGTRITVSIGTASYPSDCDSSEDLVQRATDALNEARRMGRNRVWCYMRRPRVPFETPVFFDAVDPLLVGYTRDLSPSGLFVQTAAPIDIGMRCAFAFAIPGHARKVQVIGRVVRTVAPLTGNDTINRVPGMGIEFERFGTASDRHAIDSYLHAHESETLRPEGQDFSF